MAQPKMSIEDVKAKIEWEGGLRATLEYGLKGADIADPSLAAAWDQVAALYDVRTDRWFPDPTDRFGHLRNLLKG